MRFPRLGKKASRTGRLIQMQSMGRPVWTPRQYDKLAKEGYEQNAIGYRCVRMIAEAVSSIPALMYSGSDEITEHAVLSLLASPNPTQSGPAFIDAVMSHLMLSGNAYIEGVQLNGELRELYSLRPDRMKCIAGPKGYPSAYEYTVGSSILRFTLLPNGQQQPILHIRLFHPTNDHYGMSPIEAVARAIDNHNDAGAFNKSLLQNSARPSGALVYEGEGSLTDEQFRRLKGELEESYSGPANAGKPMVLEGGLKWQQMSYALKDMEFLEGRRESAREIALGFGVPPMLLGIPGDNTYSNYKEANRAFWRQTVLPYAGRLYGELTRFLFPDGSARLGYDLDKIEALSAEREELWKRVGEAEYISTDEKRAAVGYGDYAPDEKAPGSRILINASQVPLESAFFEPGDEEPDDTQDDIPDPDTEE